MARILIIDDNELLLETVASSLRAAGHAVTAAANGRLALKLVREEPPDLVITDIIMPEQDGVGVAMALRQEFPSIPVIAMSGDAAHSALYFDLMKKLGARRLLAKPFTIVELLAAVAQMLADSSQGEQG